MYVGQKGFYNLVNTATGKDSTVFKKILTCMDGSEQAEKAAEAEENDMNTVELQRILGYLNIGLAIAHDSGVSLGHFGSGDFIQLAPLKRTGTPTDITDTVLFLVHAKFITGQTLIVDGGRSL